MDATFFKSPAEWRDWLETHHATESSLLVGFYKKDSGKLNMTYQQALDEALCFGWIDGVRGSLSDEAYTMKFHHRKPHSIWSAVNIKRIGELAEQGVAPGCAVEARQALRLSAQPVHTRTRLAMCRTSTGFNPSATGAAAGVSAGLTSQR